MNAPQWTNEQKHRNLRKHDLVSVRVTKTEAGANVHRWVEARIVNVQKHGAYCKLEGSGNSSFFHWREIEPNEQAPTFASPPEPPKPIATLGEVARVLPLHKPEPTPQPARQATVLISSADLKRHAVTTEQKPKPRNSYSIRMRPDDQQMARRAVLFGDLIAKKRHMLGLVQKVVAERVRIVLGVRAFDQAIMSRYEVGHTLPNDETTLALAEVLELELNELLKVRDGKPERLKSILGEASTRPAIPPPAMQPTQQSALVDPTFLMDLMSVAPAPTEPEARKRWLAAATELFTLSRGGK